MSQERSCVSRRFLHWKSFLYASWKKDLAYFLLLIIVRGNIQEKVKGKAPKKNFAPNTYYQTVVWWTKIVTFWRFLKILDSKHDCFLSSRYKPLLRKLQSFLVEFGRRSKFEEQNVGQGSLQWWRIRDRILQGRACKRIQEKGFRIYTFETIMSKPDVRR